MNNVQQSNLEILEYLNSLEQPFIFRDGKLLASIAGFSCSGEMITIDYVDAYWDGEKIEIDLPLNFIGYVHDGDPASFFHNFFKNFISPGNV